MSDPLDPSRLPRRGFLQLGGAAALLCTIGGEEISLEKPGAAGRADAAAARVRNPVAARAAQNVPEIQPQPGGVRREYWVQARTVTWDIVPTHRDQWHNRAIGGRTKFRAFAYQQMSTGFASPVTPPSIPGPTLVAEVGDVLVVHFRNAEKDLRQGVTMHPHGVHYNPEYDGAYMGEFTRAGGFVGPGEEFTYQWEARADSVGVWPYHDHGPNHTLNTMRGLFGAVIVYPKGERRPEVEYVLFLHSLTPPVTGLQRSFQTINGRAYAGNTPTLAARVGQDVAIHAIGMDNNFHDFHVHGHRWRKDGDGPYTDNPTLGPNETATARFVEDNPGRWLYHCHVFSHQDGGMAGFYVVE